MRSETTVMIGRLASVVSVTVTYGLARATTKRTNIAVLLRTRSLFFSHRRLAAPPINIRGTSQRRRGSEK